MTPRTPLPAAFLAALALLPIERVLVRGTLADALAYAADAEEQDGRDTVVPPGGE